MTFGWWYPRETEPVEGPDWGRCSLAVLAGSDGWEGGFCARSGAGGSLPAYLCHDALSRPWMNYLCRTLLKKIWSRSRSRLICWSGSTGPCLKKVGIRIPTCWNCFAVSSIFEQTLIKKISADPAYVRRTLRVLLILQVRWPVGKVKRIRMNRKHAGGIIDGIHFRFSCRPCSILRADPDEKILSRLCLKIFCRTLIEKILSRAWSRLKMCFGTVGPWLKVVCRTLVMKRWTHANDAMPYAQKVYRLLEECWYTLLVSRLWWVSTLRNSLTYTWTCVRAVAQRGGDEPPERPRRGGKARKSVILCKTRHWKKLLKKIFKVNPR